MPNEVIETLTAEIEKANPSPAAATAEAVEPEVVVEQTKPEADDDDHDDADEGDEGDEAEGKDGDEADEQADTPDEKPARPTRKQRRQARYNEAIVARRQAEQLAEEREREAAYWREQASKGTPGPQADEGEKSLVDFNFDQAEYDAYLKERARTEVLREITQQQEAEKVKQAETQFQDRSQKFRAETPDFDDVAFKTPLGNYYTPLMVETIRDSEVGPQLAYYLGKNLDQADAILRMPPAHQARELGKIEARLEKQADVPVRRATEAAPPRTVTRAPAVGSTVHATATGSKAVGDMSVKDHLEAIRVRRNR